MTIVVFITYVVFLKQASKNSYFVFWIWLSMKSISFCFRNKLFGQNSSVAISVWFGICQTEIATEEFSPKSLLRKQNEIDFIESHIQILHHLKIVRFVFSNFEFIACSVWTQSLIVSKQLQLFHNYTTKIWLAYVLESRNLPYWAVIRDHSLKCFIMSSVAMNDFYRGEVEDTWLEAKDTKKIQGQGQPFREQTLSRPRTRMLEAKAKDQGHSCKCSQKKINK